VEFLRERRFRADLAHWVAARRPFGSGLTRVDELRTMAACLNELEDLSARISDIEEHSGLPGLLRHYLRLGGRVAAFHVDCKFSDALDGLLILDLREARRRCWRSTWVRKLSKRQAREPNAVDLSETCSFQSIFQVRQLLIPSKKRKRLGVDEHNSRSLTLPALCQSYLVIEHSLRVNDVV
jgi:hypothetical protein